MATVNEQLATWNGRNAFARAIFSMPADTHRGWTISFDYPPIPVRDFDYSATHPDYDGAPDANDDRLVHGRTRGDVIAAIDAWHDDDEAVRCDCGEVTNNADPVCGACRIERRPVTLASSYRIIDDYRAGRMGKLAPAEVVTSGYSDADAETVIAEMRGRRL